MSNDHIMTTTKASIEATMKRKLRYWDNSLDGVVHIATATSIVSVVKYILLSIGSSDVYICIIILYTAIILYNIHSECFDEHLAGH